MKAFKFMATRVILIKAAAVGSYPYAVFDIFINTVYNIVGYTVAARVIFIIGKIVYIAFYKAYSAIGGAEPYITFHILINGAYGIAADGAWVEIIIFIRLECFFYWVEHIHAANV